VAEVCGGGSCGGSGGGERRGRRHVAVAAVCSSSPLEVTSTRQGRGDEKTCHRYVWTQFVQCGHCTNLCLYDQKK
jgi:hypothetical protein